MRPYDLVCFDLDGTLSDPTVGITRSVAFALARFGIVEPVARLVPFIGPPLHGSFVARYGLTPARAWEAVGGYREYFARQGMYENVVFDGIPALLGRLRGAGVACCVVTSKPHAFAIPIVRHFGLDGFFDPIVGPELDLANADKATLLATALARYPGLVRDRVAMVGDREHDISGARACGTMSIGVTYGAGSREELAAAGPTRIVDSVEALGAALLGRTGTSDE